jgi:hypothetical protein
MLRNPNPKIRPRLVEPLHIYVCCVLPFAAMSDLQFGPPGATRIPASTVAGSMSQTTKRWLRSLRPAIGECSKSE